MKQYENRSVSSFLLVPLLGQLFTAKTNISWKESAPGVWFARVGTPDRLLLFCG